MAAWGDGGPPESMKDHAIRICNQMHAIVSQTRLQGGGAPAPPDPYGPALHHRQRHTQRVVDTKYVYPQRAPHRSTHFLRPPTSTLGDHPKTRKGWAWAWRHGQKRGAVEGPRDNKSRRKGDRRTQSSSWRCSMEIQMVAVSLWLHGRGIGTWPPNMPSSAATGSLACAGTGATRVGKGAASDTDWAGDVPSSSSSA